MQKAIKLAEKGRGRTSPNPLVGAVVVKNGMVVGEGYHAKAGEPHAEIIAIRGAAKAARDATLYVTLEPCCTYGKTPPCTEEIISSGIKRVVIGLIDPNPKVNGRGVDELKKAQIEVLTGLLEKKVAKQNEIYVKYITTKSPFVLMKSAISFDGKITSKNGQPAWITNEKSRRIVHELRNTYDAILIGVNTIIADNPILNTRLNRNNLKNPLRIIVDSNARIPLKAKVVETAKEIPTLLATTKNAPAKKIETLNKMGVQILELPDEKGEVDLKSLLKELGKKETASIILEGGARLNSSFIKKGFVDKMIFFVAPKIIGGNKSLNFITNTDVSVDFIFDKIRLAQGDLLIEAYPKANQIVEG